MIRKICGHSFRHPIVTSTLPRVLGCLLLILALIPFLFHTILDVDLFWHMSCGKELLTTGKIDYTHLYYSIVTDLHSNQKFTWMGDILLFLIHYVGGAIGLQLFRSILICLLPWFLWEVSDKKLNLFKVCVGILVLLGCGQLYLLRNSIFSLLFYPMLWYFILKNKPIHTIILLMLWSMIHGSYMMGIIMAPIIYISSLKNFRYWIFFSLIGLVVLLNSVLPIQNYLHLPTSFNLNDTIFHVDSLTSRDFLSPFIYLKPYTVAMLILTGMVIGLIKKPKLVYILPFIATFIPGFGYIRMIGYHAITCAIVLIFAECNGDIRRFPGIMYLPPAVFGIIIIWACYFQFFGLGLHPKYRELSGIDYKSEVLSTDTIAGYLYFQHGIRGYIDTFFEPHPSEVRNQYNIWLMFPERIPAAINTCMLSKDDAFYFYKSEVWEKTFEGTYNVVFRRKEKKE